eukprot:CAMPEP_0179064042 /NCGR_PEP_ID=MMETSP0796-20121207/27746_1 /TAXON_ID=73915 /ORGANISM="Pyrodinium bahamense, Strain pbaha01" /LENGTH=251 /DNA_ID=CAMNT_0020760981 /DNA_START=443 /DNA_END=1199 /DNA_ORIENTATION=-
MPLQVTRLLQRRVPPQGQLVPGVAMGRQQLTLLRAPDDTSDLALRVRGHEQLPVRGVPEADLAVRRTTAGGQDVPLPRAPPQRLHGRSVLRQHMQGAARCWVLPDADGIVVATRGERPVHAVIQAADKIRVGTCKPAHKVLTHSNVMMMDLCVGGAAAQHVLVPGQCTYAPTVTTWLRSCRCTHASQICTSPDEVPTPRCRPSPVHRSVVALPVGNVSNLSVRPDGTSKRKTISESATPTTFLADQSTGWL